VDAVNTPTYDKDITVLLVVDPYNDFISEGGKIWPHVASMSDCLRASSCNDTGRLAGHARVHQSKSHQCLLVPASAPLADSASAVLIADRRARSSAGTDDPLRAITRVLGGGVCIVARCPFSAEGEQEPRVIILRTKSSRI
jgi:hypothetical protein